jgi:hypothetical protein
MPNGARLGKGSEPMRLAHRGQMAGAAIDLEIGEVISLRAVVRHLAFSLVRRSLSGVRNV